MKLISNFARSDHAAVGMMFGLLMLPLILVAGAAVDYSRASALQSKLQAATDSTALALCQAGTAVLNDSPKTKALTSIQEYVSNSTVAVSDLTFVDAPRSLTLKTTASYPTAFMKIVNSAPVALTATSSCSASEAYFEIALVLDTTGSMSSSGGTQTKMEAAKTAAGNFVDYMFTTGALPGRIRMSLVPFAASVAIPTASRSASWLDTKGVSPVSWQYIKNPTAQSFTSRLSVYDQLKAANSDWAWGGCVESPVYPYNVKDEAVSDSASLIVPLLAPDEIPGTCSLWGISYSCANNNYMDDGTSTSSSSSCRSNDPSSEKRFTQACKYKTPTNIDKKASGPNWGCTSRPLSQLGTAQATLKTEITALQPSGNTNIHEGFMWGWRTISPTSVFSSQSAPPVAYGTKNYTKIIVLMTDGENTWNADSSTHKASIGQSDYSAYGYFRNSDGSDATLTNSRLKTGRSNMSSGADARAAIDELTAEACTNAKAKKVLIYTVGFSTKNDPIDAKGLKLLSDCSSGEGYSYVSSDAAGLIADFQKIAKGIGQLRITH